MGYCDFKTTVDKVNWHFSAQPPSGWATSIFGVRGLGPAYGDPPKNQPIKRCPACNRRLKLKAIFCIGGEFTCWVLPDHKPRETRRPGPTRQSRSNGRGK